MKIEKVAIPESSKLVLDMVIMPNGNYEFVDRDVEAKRIDKKKKETNKKLLLKKKKN